MHLDLLRYECKTPPTWPWALTNSMNQDPGLPSAVPASICSSTYGFPRIPPREEANKENYLWGLETGVGQAGVGADGNTGATLSGNFLDFKFLH